MVTWYVQIENGGKPRLGVISSLVVLGGKSRWPRALVQPAQRTSSHKVPARPQATVEKNVRLKTESQCLCDGDRLTLNIHCECFGAVAAEGAQDRAELHRTISELTRFGGGWGGKEVECEEQIWMRTF